jgi:hypothetical protein
MLKLPALKRLESPCKLTLVIPGNGDPELIFRAKGYLDLIPFLDSSHIEIGPPVIIDSGCDDVTRPEYTLIANGHLERGLRIEDWHPEWATDYDYPIVVPQEAKDWAADIHEEVGLDKPLLLMYASSRAWNVNVVVDEWNVKHWGKLIKRLNESGIRPVLLGKHWDHDYSTLMRKECGDLFLDLTGKTTEAQCFALFERAAAMVGICSGLTILAVHAKVKSITFWPEVGKGKGAPMLFHREFARDWVGPKQLSDGTYLPLSFGDFDIGDVTDRLTEWGIL